MKNLKLFLLSFAFIASILTSCTNDDAVVEAQNIEASESITTSLARLSEQFTSEGDVIPSQNPTGNIVFDFCFDFVYPLDLSYNSGTTVTVNSLNDLIEVLINSTNDLYINGISFPFNVETYDDASDAIVVVTINSEADFISLLEGCDFNNVSPCECYEVYDPVCVEIVAPNGDTFLMTYPNACYAECDGFTEADFAENCVEDYNSPGGNGCFSFNFPLTITTDDGQIITVNSQEELDNALYNAYYFDFEYPFDVTLSDDGNVVSINSGQDFEDLLENCFNYNDCALNIEDLQNMLMLCDVYEVVISDLSGNLVDINQVNFNENGEIVVNGEITVTDLGSWSLSSLDDEITLVIAGLQNFTLLNGTWELTDCSFEMLEFNNGNNIINLQCGVITDCIECENEPYDPVCVLVEENNGNTYIATYPNACYAECEGFTESDFVDCSDTTTDCTTEAVLQILFECPWIANNINTYIFNPDGTVNITGSGLTTIGTWTIYMNSNGHPTVSIEAEIGNFNDDWNFIDCNLINSLTVISALNPAGNIVIGCD